jgi:DNA-binding response OmpR family regulator
MTTHKNPNGRILVVEDTTTIAEMLGEFLEGQGYAVDFAFDGTHGLQLATANPYDAIILDVLLPELSGLEVCRQLRRHAKSITPILMLTACKSIEDKIEGLESGADDYLVKPFEMRELEARVRALLRRDRHQVSIDVMKVANVIFYPGTLEVIRANRTLHISPIGLKLLTILMRESPSVVSARDIEREIWGDSLSDPHVLRSHVHNLRRIIDKPFSFPLLHTIHSTGYRIADLREELVAQES